MNTRKAATLLLFIVSFVILSVSGYQCATEILPSYPGGDRQVVPLPAPAPAPAAPLIAPAPPPAPTNPFPPAPSNYSEDNCRERSLLRKAFSAPYARIELNGSALTDFRLGRRGNFDNNCARVFVKMNGSTYKKKTVYQGTLSFAYLGTCVSGQYGICKSQMRSGYSIEEARFNKWTSKPTKDNYESSEFHAIFEDSYGAYILKLTDIRTKDISDGQVQYVGAGDIYYKMFRMAGPADVHAVDKAGDCYNSGTYISQAHSSPPRPSTRCWLTKSGPYSCRPNGDLLRTDKVKDIKLKGNYKCYNHFGSFYDLDIEEAFNISL